MVLYVIRHGKAEPHAQSGLDRDRPLHERGLRQAMYLGRTLAACDEPPARILSSPFIRTRDTARTIALALDLPLTFDARLEVDEPIGPVLELIASLGASRAIAIVGHNPQVEYLLAFLLPNEDAPPRRVRTGEAFALRLAEPDRASAHLLASWRLD